MAMTLTARETALLNLCVSGSHERAAAIDECRRLMGRPMITSPLERARVALVLTEGGHDGMGRVAHAHGDMAAAAKADFSISDVAAGR